MSSSNRLLILLLIFIVLCAPSVHAFGAGNIPSFAYLEGKAFRHGDIEDTLAELLKKGAAGGGFALGSFLGGGSKFGGLDIKRVYFGNWLRDYSQAVDIAGLKKLPLQTIINLCMVLGFLANGFATHEFEVTEERLGVYLPTEHIDNPKGYGDGEDARKYDPRLRGPIDPRELEVDPRTGMKNYIANENGSWDTSKALVRRTLERCIHLGRQHKASGNKYDQYEAYRLLGQSLHTLEDFAAHSNFCELALVSQGHHQVFTHVGDHVKIRAPNGKDVAPIVTGTFGSSDFIFSLLGEATDHIVSPSYLHSEASVSDLNKEFSKARSMDSSSSSYSAIRDLIFKLPGDSSSEVSRDMEGIERIRAGPSSGGKRPEDLSPQELHAVLWQIMTFRDSSEAFGPKKCNSRSSLRLVVKKITKTIEKIPGLGPLIDKIMDSISVFIYTTLEPYVKPLLRTATSGLSSASAEVIDNHDQYEVFNDPICSDPTHSFLSKDHFNLILNEPAGNLAKLVLIHTVKLVTTAWEDNSVNVQQLTDDILQCLFHPDFHNPNSKIQREMLQYMRTWADSHGHKRADVFARLSKEAVRNHQNVRLGGEDGAPQAQGSVGWNAGEAAHQKIQGYVNQIPGVSQATSLMNTLGVGGGGGRREFSPPSGPPSGPGVRPGSDSGRSYAPPSMPPSGVSSYSTSGESASYYSSSPPPPGAPPVPTHSRPYEAQSSSFSPPPGPPNSFQSGPYSPPSGYGFAPPPSNPYQSSRAQPYNQSQYSGGPPYPPPQSQYPGGPPPPPGPPPQGGYQPQYYGGPPSGGGGW
ncbi:Het-C-domain-containing protein [Sistotremastrum suecicum HHB10207 ss-3]|uniref:Het-C-domain-containing protein n=1 Tax=Sistotremastrum suecicum HHB10207 ss-3 TaxID=1314776 RepID=A0A166IAI9_9AGAM|nr:Het-C-domain-containing protein [Sistotremastrum suecicum HHB10207 ss-3]